MVEGTVGSRRWASKACSSFIPPRRSWSDVFVLIDYFIFDYFKVDFTDVVVATVVPLFQLPLHKQCHFLPILRQGSNKIRFQENALNAVEKVSMFTRR